MLSLSLAPFPLLSSVSRSLLSPPVVIENGQLSALRHVLRGKQGEEQYIAL